MAQGHSLPHSQAGLSCSLQPMHPLHRQCCTMTTTPPNGAQRGQDPENGSHSAAHMHAYKMHHRGMAWPKAPTPVCALKRSQKMPTHLVQPRTVNLPP